VAATRFSRARLGASQSGFFIRESELRSELRKVSNHLRMLLKFPSLYTPSRVQSMVPQNQGSPLLFWRCV